MIEKTKRYKKKRINQELREDPELNNLIPISMSMIRFILCPLGSVF